MHTRIPLSLLFFVGLSQIGWTQTTTPKERLAGIDTLLEQVLDDYHVAGFSVAVVDKDSIIYAKGFGYRDYGQKLPATPQTLYAIGSSSKAFTAALLGKLFGDSLSLDDKVTQHLPQLQFQDGREADVTVRDLMTHRTGLTRYDFSWYVFNSDSRDSLLHRVKYMKPSADLRAKWQYNNFMYLAQGMIAERMTGKTWEENIREHFLDPLGMTRTNFDVKDMADDADASLGYTINKQDSIKKMPYFALRGMGPAGSINSSVEEMASWLRLWLKGGSIDGKDILDRDYIKDAASSQMVMADGLPSMYPDIHISNYGLGWMIGSYRGHYQVQHGGNIDGFSANACFFPMDGLGIVVLCNQNASAIPSVVRNLIADRALNLSFIDWNTNKVKKDSATVDTTGEQEDLARVKGTRPSHVLADYAGAYNHPAYGTFNLNLHGDTLKGMVGKERVWLSHYHYDVFELKDVDEEGRADTSAGGIKINFRTGLDGQVEGAAISMDDPSGDPVTFKRQPEVKEVSEEQLQAYVGRYEVSGMRITITVKNGTLYMDVPGQTNYETVANGDHNFKLKALSGFALRFEIDESTGKANVLYSIQPNGTFKATRVESGG